MRSGKQVAVKDIDGGLKSVAAAVELLDVFANDEELGVTDVARRLGLAKSTAHRLLKTLAAGGLIEQSAVNGRYRLGLHLYELGHLVVSRQELRSMALGVMEELREATSSSVHLSVARGTDTLILERLSTFRGLQAFGDMQRRWPLHATASGKSICAFDDSAGDARLAAGLPPMTPKTITSATRFRAELDAIRRAGYARADGEAMLRLSSIAAPVLDHRGVAAATVAIVGATVDFDRAGDRLARVVVAAGHRLSQLYQSKVPREHAR